MPWIARIVMGLIGLFFLAGLIVALAGYTVFAAVRWLLTGRAPQLVLVWQRMRSFQSGAAGSMGAGGQGAGEVVDVEVREVSEVHEVREVREVHEARNSPARLPHEPR